MTEEILHDKCKVTLKNSIEPALSVEEDTAYTGLHLIQQERLREHTELAQYASPRGHELNH